MKKAFKKVTAVILTVMILLSCSTVAFAGGDGPFGFLGHTDVETAEKRYNNGEKFVLFYYDENCSNSETVWYHIDSKWNKPFGYWPVNAVDICGIKTDWGYPSFMYNDIGGSVSLPVVAFIENGKATYYQGLTPTDVLDKKFAEFYDEIVYVESASISKTALLLSVGQKEQLTVTVYPSDATQKEAYWRSSDYSVAGVSDGVVTAKAPGKATITAETIDGSIELTCTVTVSVSTYNLGEETYSFENFEDSHANGHCFGMAVTSSSYHLDLLDMSSLGIESCEVNLLKNTDKVREPICHYQEIQGTYKSQAYITTDQWSEAVECVRDHTFDNLGSVIVDTWIYDDYEDEWYGHSVNFLYYKNVNGQDRIYVYDNNFPEIETYYYQDSNGYIQQAPKSTFGTNILTIDLISILGYMECADSFEPTRVIYAEGKNISIDGVEGSPMTGAIGEETKYMFEIPNGVEQITITPLVDNAEFTYLDEKYAFGEVDDTTVGVFTLASSDNNADSPQAGLEITNESGSIWDLIWNFILLIINLILLPISIFF